MNTSRLKREQILAKLDSCTLFDKNSCNHTSSWGREFFDFLKYINNVMGVVLLALSQDSADHLISFDGDNNIILCNIVSDSCEEIESTAHQNEHKPFSISITVPS